VVVTLEVVEQLLEQLLAQEEELCGKEGTIVVWEDGLMIIEHALEKS
jgi:hypothetical protein